MKIEICECDCHIKGGGVRHVVPCCRWFGGHQYINKDGTFDWIAVGEAIRDSGYRPIEENNNE